MNSLEWSGGMERWTGLLEWSTGVGVANFVHLPASKLRVFGFAGLERWNGLVDWTGREWNGMENARYKVRSSSALGGDHCRHFAETILRTLWRPGDEATYRVQRT